MKEEKNDHLSSSFLVMYTHTHTHTSGDVKKDTKSDENFVRLTNLIRRNPDGKIFSHRNG